MIVVIVALVVAQVWLEIEIPRHMGAITQSITSANENLSAGAILASGGIMVALAAGSLAAALISVYLSSTMAANFAARLRAVMFSKVESFSQKEVNQFSPASLITRTTTDVSRVQMLVGMGVRLFVRAPVMAIWAITRIANQNWYFMALVGVAYFIMITLVVVLVIIAVPRFKRTQQLLDNINRLTKENLSGIRVVRAYNAQNYQAEKFETANSEMTRVQLFVERSMQVMHPGMALVISGLTLGITVITALLIYAAGVDVSYGMPAHLYGLEAQGVLFADMIMFNQYARMAIMAFVLLIFIFANLPRAIVSSKRILEVLNTASSVTDGVGVVAKAENMGTVQFNNVSFKYPDAEEAVIEGISFSANRGEVVAFIGSTGSGKSSLINLVPRFYDATGGEIFISGENIKHYKLADLNRQIGYISQKGVIFKGTIKENIAYGEMGDELSESQILEALEIAQAKDFVMQKDGVLQAETAQGGTNLSGGQKQRISIARALAKKPPILIFDDSFSALDYRTDKLLRAALNKEFATATKLIVAQRIGTIKDADKIIVLEKGRIVGEGKHTHLMQTCKVYKEIALSQLSEEELK